MAEHGTVVVSGAGTGIGRAWPGGWLRPDVT
jgi:hypothetical protein